jgi:hypothetical protein
MIVRRVRPVSSCFPLTIMKLGAVSPHGHGQGSRSAGGRPPEHKIQVISPDTGGGFGNNGTVWFCGSGCLRAFADSPTTFISV